MMGMGGDNCCTRCIGCTLKTPSPKAYTLGRVLFAVVIAHFFLAAARIVYFAVMVCLTDLYAALFGLFIARRYIRSEFSSMKSCMICCETTQMLWMFVISVWIDVIFAIVNVVEIATYDGKGKMGRFDIKPWQWKAGVIISGVGVVIYILETVLAWVLWTELKKRCVEYLPVQDPATEEGGAQGGSGGSPFGFPGMGGGGPTGSTFGSENAPAQQKMERDTVFNTKGNRLGSTAQPAKIKSGGAACCGGRDRGDSEEKVTVTSAVADAEPAMSPAEAAERADARNQRARAALLRQGRVTNNGSSSSTITITAPPS